MAYSKQGFRGQKRRCSEAVRPNVFDEDKKEIEILWRLGELFSHNSKTYPIGIGAVVRGNYSQIKYCVDRIHEDGEGNWWVSGKEQGGQIRGWFAKLGKREGNEVFINDESRPHDRLIIVDEPYGKPQTIAEKSLKTCQAIFSFMES